MVSYTDIIIILGAAVVVRAPACCPVHNVALC